MFTPQIVPDYISYYWGQLLPPFQNTWELLLYQLWVFDWVYVQLIKERTIVIIDLWSYHVSAWCIAIEILNLPLSGKKRFVIKGALKILLPLVIKRKTYDS